MSLLFRRLPLTPVLLGLALVGIFYCYEISEPVGSRWQSIPVIRFSPDGKTLAVGMYSGRFIYTKGAYYMADLCATTALVQPGDASPPTLVEQLLSKGIWNALPEIAIGRFVDWSPDGRQLAIGGFLRTRAVGEFQGAVRLYEVGTPEPTSEIATNAPHVHSVKFSPDGNILATAFRYWIDLRDPQGRQPSRKLELGVNVAGFAFSSDGKTLAVLDRGNCRVEFWSLAADVPARTAVYEEVDPDGRTDSSKAIAFSPDGKTVAFAGERTVRLLDVASNTPRKVLNERMVLDVAYSPDGKRLATGRYDGVQIWDAETGERIGKRIEMPAVESLAFSPDSRQLVTGDDTGRLTLWNVGDQTRAWSTQLTGRYRTVMPSIVPLFLFAAWLAVCGYFVWRKMRRT